MAYGLPLVGKMLFAQDALVYLVRAVSPGVPGAAVEGRAPSCHEAVVSVVQDEGWHRSSIAVLFLL